LRCCDHFALNPSKTLGEVIFISVTYVFLFMGDIRNRNVSCWFWQQSPASCIFDQKLAETSSIVWPPIVKHSMPADEGNRIWHSGNGI
jgi:hypothetical protein